MKQTSDMPVLILDFDFVIADIGPGCQRACAAATGLPQISDEWTVYDQWKQYSMTLESFLDAMIKYRVLEEALIAPGTRQALEKAKANGLRLVVVSARGFHPNGKRITEVSCSEHQLPIDDVIMVDASASKKDVIAGYPNVVGYVDDLPSHLDDIATLDREIPLFLMSRPWNVDNSEHSKVSSMDEFVIRAIQGMNQRRNASPRFSYN
jgi:hypothetical protein